VRAHFCSSASLLNANRDMPHRLFGGTFDEVENLARLLGQLRQGPDIRSLRDAGVHSRLHAAQQGQQWITRERPNQIDLAVVAGLREKSL
jgi:hypothetical protein